jgi:DMSO reductase anchor subunit
VAGGSETKVQTEWWTAAGLLLLGIIVSLFHLGHPTGSIRAILNLGSSWLSREAIGAGLTLGLIVLTALTLKKQAIKALPALAVAAGLFMILFSGMTYAPPSLPALNNVLPYVFFMLTAAILGSALAAYFSPPEKIPLIRTILTVSLLIGLVIHLVAPCAWLSGGTVMKMTGMGYMTSTLYWLHIVVGLILPLALIYLVKGIPVWLPVVVLLGQIMGRIVFFTQTIHTAVQIGGIF